LSDRTQKSLANPNSNKISFSNLINGMENTAADGQQSEHIMRLEKQKQWLLASAQTNQNPNDN
jgi:hypothetical protein